VTLLWRLGTVSGLALGWVWAVAASPLLLPLVFVIDVLRGGRWALLRAYLFVLVFLSAELWGVTAAFLRWLWPSRRGWLEHHYQLQRRWVRTLFDSARWLYGAKIEVEGLEAAERGPFLLLVRHVSVADTLLPTRLLSDRYGLRLRFVLKRDLLFDPCLDIVGQRLPNAFVARGSRDRDEDLAAVRGLLTGLGPDGGVLLFPEGTRYTPERRAQVLARLKGSTTPERLAKAERLSQVLPPRLGGLEVLLAADPPLDVVICAHTGFEGTTRLLDFWKGSLIGRRIQIAFWRIDGASIPKDPEGRVDWIYREWQRVDDWVKAHSGTGQ
jgi:1-acyl-sn-glycerol-3-phosphate acyltransferase